MSSTEVLIVLKKNPYLTAPEIAEIANKSKQSVMRIMKSLMQDVSEPLCYRELTSEEKLEKYGKPVNCKLRIYWLDK